MKYGVVKSFVKLYQNYFQLGQSIIDKVVLMGGIKHRFTFEFDGEENLHKIAALKKGGILLSAHVGNWDIAGYFLQRIETKIHIVIFDGEHQKIKEYLEKVTTKIEINMIVIKNDLSHIYAINDALKKNELVCMHADRFIEGNKTIEHNFLGSKAKFPAGPFILAAKFKVPVAFVFAMKEGLFHYHLFTSSIKDYSHLNKDEIMETMVGDFIAEVEQKVKTYPEQWFNYYNFWK